MNCDQPMPSRARASSKALPLSRHSFTLCSARARRRRFAFPAQDHAQGPQSPGPFQRTIVRRLRCPLALSTHESRELNRQIRPEIAERLERRKICPQFGVRELKHLLHLRNIAQAM